MRKVTTAHDKHKGSRLAKGRRFRDSRAPGLQDSEVAGFQGSKVTGLQESKVAGFNGFKTLRFQSSGITSSRALQRSNVAMSRGKLPSLHHDPKDAGLQGFRLSLRLKGSKILRFQLSTVPWSISPSFSGFHV